MKLLASFLVLMAVATTSAFTTTTATPVVVASSSTQLHGWFDNFETGGSGRDSVDEEWEMQQETLQKGSQSSQAHQSRKKQAKTMDPFDVYDMMSEIADGGTTKTSAEIQLEVDISGESGLRQAFSDLIIPFSIGGGYSNNIDGSRDPHRCSLCSKTDSWTELFKDLPEDDRNAAMKELSEDTIPSSALLKIATPAPFGKGSETVIDANVRKAFEIPASALPDELFPKNAPPNSSISHKIASLMKPSKSKWSYKLYKMHIYNKGGKFAPHVDTLHTDNHVATLVVSLPGEYEGGEFLVKQGDIEMSYNLSTGKRNMKWIAFYTDCTHEVQEVTSGCRIVLQYDIYEDNSEDKSKDQKETEKENDSDEEYYGYGSIEFDYFFEESYPNLKSNVDVNTFVDRVSGVLKSGRPGHGVAMLMRHRYSLGSLEDATLKGLDRLIYDAVQSSPDLKIALTGVILLGTTDYKGNYHERELAANAISISDFDEAAAPVDFPCESATLYLDEEGDVTSMKHEEYVEYTGNEAREGSMTYRSCAFVIALASATADTE